MNNPFPDFWGNKPVSSALAQMLSASRIPQTILLAGPEGVGKATLVRRFAARLLGDAAKIEQDDLSLQGNVELIEQRGKWPAEKRADDPLIFASHPDFVTLAPDGPLRQVSIQQARLLKDRALFRPLRGGHRVFLIDRLDRANEQAANSLLKLLEEPPDYLIVFATAENLYDLLPTIRSRSVVFQLTRLTEDEMHGFIQEKSLSGGELRQQIAEGCPGAAVTLDLAKYKERRDLVLSLFECASGAAPFSDWIQNSESFSNRKTEKLDFYLKPAYGLLEDLLWARQGNKPLLNRDVQNRVAAVAAGVDFGWIERATRSFDELALLVRRNIQKIIALDAVIMDLRNQLRVDRA
ncbi:MAG: AAA family ATPase [Bryobacteraceae bacterium]